VLKGKTLYEINLFHVDPHLKKILKIMFVVNPFILRRVSNLEGLGWRFVIITVFKPIQIPDKDSVRFEMSYF
jgi:hypothetical protein